MKNIVLIAFISLLAISCQTKINPSDVHKINGYWEIEKVVFPEGKDKEYTINQTFDYFELKNNSGFRKKVSPQLDGSFLVNDSSEHVEIKEEKGIYYIYYSTEFSKWKEELVAISDDKLVTRNAAKNEYHYKRAGAINILGDGKKTK